MYLNQLAPIQIGIFISHSWAYSEHYETLAGWFFDETWNSNGRQIRFLNYSVPKDNPIHYAANDTDLYAAISSRIANSDVVIMPTGMYSTHSKWIGKEIQASNNLRRPILAVNPWGQERKSSVVAEAAIEVVGWNKMSVVGGTWRHYSR